jgi:hypothetical protein
MKKNIFNKRVYLNYNVKSIAAIRKYYIYLQSIKDKNLNRLFVVSMLLRIVTLEVILFGFHSHG